MGPTLNLRTSIQGLRAFQPALSMWHKAMQRKQRRSVSQCGLAISIKKYLKAKEELWKLKYFTMQKI
jgi:hypothetical protein